MFRIFFLALCLAVSLVGCGEEFLANPDAGTGGDAGSAGDGGTGNTGNTGGSAGDGGTGTGGGGQGGDGGSNPCPDATYDDIADLFAPTCGSLFQSGCSTADKVERGEFITVTIDQTPVVHLMGYNDPISPSFSDVSLTHAAEKALWLKLIPDTSAFHPADPTTTCFAADDVVAKLNILPPVHSVRYEVTASQFLGAGVGPIPSVSYHAWGADGTSAPKKITAFDVVCNTTSGDFTDPESCPAVSNVVIRCSLPNNSGYNSYSVALDNSGTASFTGMDCYHQTGGEHDIQVQFYTSGTAQATQKISLDINPNTFLKRQERPELVVPTFTIN